MGEKQLVKTFYQLLRQLDESQKRALLRLMTALASADARAQSGQQSQDRS